jgi:hypothetical protein
MAHPHRTDPRPAEGAVSCEYRDDYLELLRLLVEAAGLEHSLMLAYLFGVFSLKPEYAAIAGDLSLRSYLQNSALGPQGTRPPTGNVTLLDIAIEEMQHLSLINRLLVGLGAAPHVVPHVFPLSSSVYQFPIDMRALDRSSVATFLWLEASTGSLSLPAAAEDDHRRLIVEVHQVISEDTRIHRAPPLDQQTVSHIGSLYHVILLQLATVAEHPPSFLPATFPWGEWDQRLRWVQGQGETGHYRFFRDLFSGKLIGGVEKWTEGISRKGFTWRTAYPRRPDSIPDERARLLGWLSNLHYWCILSLLDLSYRDSDHRFRYTGIDHMTTSLWRLGTHLADRYGTGLPFDPMATRYALGRTSEFSRQILTRLVTETERFAQDLDRQGLLPDDYDRQQFANTYASLGIPPAPAARPR